MKVIKRDGYENVFPYIAYVPENISSHPALLVQLHGAGERGNGGNALGKGDVFFATLNDGSAVCLPSSEYESVKSKVTMGYSGMAHLLQDGYVLGQTDNSTLARAAVGVSENGNEVYLLVVDGGDFFYSNGIGCNDLALLMKGCGAHNALAISSGNNVTSVWRNMRSENLFDLLNKPANKGVEAPIAGGILIVQ